MDYVKEIAKLKEILNNDGPDVSLAQSELYYRQIRSELMLKRDQVEQLKNELQAANSKIFDITKEIEINKSILKDTEFNLKLSLTKSATLEEKLKECNDANVNLKLKEEMRLSEIEILNKHNQKMAHENHQLSSEIDDLKNRLKYAKAFQNELENRQMKINSIIAKTSENVEKLEKEKTKLGELEAKLRSVDEMKNSYQLLINENNKLKKRNNKLESSLIETNGKFENLYNLLKRHINLDKPQENTVSKIKFLQWESQHKYLQQKTKNYEEIINNLTTTLREETETNARLLNQIEEYKTSIQKHEEKKFENMKIKTEDIVEIE